MQTKIISPTKCKNRRGCKRANEIDGEEDENLDRNGEGMPSRKRKSTVSGPNDVTKSTCVCLDPCALTVRILIDGTEHKHSIIIKVFQFTRISCTTCGNWQHRACIRWEDDMPDAEYLCPNCIEQTVSYVVNKTD